MVKQTARKSTTGPVSRPIEINPIQSSRFRAFITSPDRESNSQENAPLPARNPPIVAPPEPPARRNIEGPLRLRPIAKREFISRRRYNRRLMAMRQNQQANSRANITGQPPMARQYGVGSGKGGLKRMAQVHGRSLLPYHAIRQAQRTPECSIPMAAFMRIVKEIFNDLKREKERENESLRVERFQMAAARALRDISEAFIVDRLETSFLFTTHARRVTLMPKDMALAKRLDKWHVRESQG